MRNHIITYLTLCLALLAGCNKVAFIDDAARLEVSANDLVIEDTGGTVTIAVNQEDWMIHSVEMKDRNGKVPYKGLDGVGEIRYENEFGGFWITRDSYDSLTVSMKPNFTNQERQLHITLKGSIETVVLNIIQNPTEGFMIDHIEWDEEPEITEEILLSKSYRIVNDTEDELSITIDPYESACRTMLFESDNHLFWLSISEILVSNNLDMPVPGPYPENGRLIFDGHIIDNPIAAIIDPMEFDKTYETTCDLGYGTHFIHVYLNNISYKAGYKIHMRHVTDCNVTKIFSGTFTSETPDGENHYITTETFDPEE